MSLNQIASLARRWNTVLALGVYALLVLFLFGGVLFTRAPLILSFDGSDMSNGEAYAHEFMFRSLVHGHMPFWNPYELSGNPFYTESQVAVFYPLTWLQFAMPVYKAIDWIIAIDVFLMGAFTFLWARKLGLSTPAAFLGGLMTMFCGPFFLHIYAGHVNNLSAMVWTPLVLYAAELLLENRLFAGWLLGVFALSMQLFASQPQYSYYTLLMLTIYGALRLSTSKASWPARLRMAGVFVLVCVMSGCIFAVQLLSVGHQAQESIRSGSGVTQHFASTYSLPPIQFLTLLAPSFFGESASPPYWGNYLIWEDCVYCGIAGLLLAVYGAVRGTAANRGVYIAAAAVLFVLALGAHEPLFGTLFHIVPGFNRFRGTSKFCFQAMLFVALLAGIGLDRIRGGPGAVRASVAAAVFAGLIAAFAALINCDPVLWTAIIDHIRYSHETSFPASSYQDPSFAPAALACATKGLIFAAVMAVLVAAVLFRAKSAAAAGFLVGIAALDLLLFAHHFVVSFDYTQAEYPATAKLISGLGDNRVLLNDNPDSGAVTGAQNAWGYDSFVLRRYGELMAYSQGENPDNFAAIMHPDFRVYDNNILRLARVVAILHQTETSASLQVVSNHPMPRVAVIDRCRVMPDNGPADRNAILAELNSTALDPARTVILETPPVPAPQPGPVPAGTAEVTASDTNLLTIQADLTRPAILLVTDSYSRDWKARPLPGSVQSSYSVVPADYAFRGIALQAGYHRILMYCDPPGFDLGAKISGVSLAVYLGLLGFYCVRRRRVIR